MPTQFAVIANAYASSGYGTLQYGRGTEELMRRLGWATSILLTLTFRVLTAEVTEKM